MKKNFLLVIAAIALVAAAVYVDVRWMKRNAAPKAATSASNLPDAPSFSIPDLQGANTGLEKYRGKLVLVNFWATWCGPCEIEMPWFIEFQQKYGSRGFTMVGIAMDDEGKSVVAPWIAEKRFDVNGSQQPVNYPILIGNDKIGDDFGGLIGLPTSILITRDGKILKKFVGLVSHEAYVKAIEDNL